MENVVSVRLKNVADGVNCQLLEQSEYQMTTGPFSTYLNPSILTITLVLRIQTKHKNKNLR